MPNIFEDRDNLIADVFQESASVVVTYRGRPGGPNAAYSVAWTVTIDRTEFPVADGSGVVDTALETRDFVGLASALILNGSVVEPQRGDLIDEVIGGVTYTREVMAPPGEKHYDYDASYKLIRVRTWDRQ